MSAMAQPRQKEKPFGYSGASTVGNVRSGVHAVDDCAMIVMRTRVNDRSSGESRRMVFTQPCKTLDSDEDQYIPAKANHVAGSGTFQITRIIRPIAFMTEAKVMAHAGPQRRSDEKQTMMFRKIPMAGAMLPSSLILDFEYRSKLLIHSKKAPVLF